MTIKDFLNACEQQLGRAEGVVEKPIQLQRELESLDELLRNEWPDVMVRIKDLNLKQEETEKIAIIFERIKKLELKAKTRVSIYHGIEDFMQQPRNQ